MKLWRFRCPCDPPKNEGYFASKREATEYARSTCYLCHATRCDAAKASGEPLPERSECACADLESVLDTVYVESGPKGVARALTMLPAR